MNVVNDLLFELGFGKPLHVQGRYSVADLFRKKRCGIYVLHFANDMFYVGQAVNVVRRYAQHCHNHSDIHSISFKPVSKKNLNFEESSIVYRMEKSGFRLRNIQLVSFSYGNTDFDLVMSPDSQEKWLSDLGYNDLDGQRVVDDHLRSLYKRKYEQFIQLPCAEEMIAIAKQYVQTSIPTPNRSQISFWNCTCLPYPSKGLYLRINVGWQTVFDLIMSEGIIYSKWYLTRLLTEQAFGLTLEIVNREMDGVVTLDDYPGMEVIIMKSDLIKGGLDQVFVSVEGVDNAHKLLDDRYMLSAVRLFNVGLVQKSPCPWGKNHCLDLADRLLS